jgi:hypothetical protein
MATVTREIFTCDVCGNADDVQTRSFGFDGKRYEIDLCLEDRNSLSEVAAGYVSRARKAAIRQGQRPSAKASRTAKASGAKASGAKASGAKASGAKASGAKASGAKASGAKAKSSKPEDRARRSRPREGKAVPMRAAKASGTRQEKGVYVYGILPADIEVAAGVPGVGEHPGVLDVVRSDGLAALISEVGPPDRLGSPEDRRAHREILDSTAIEVPVLPMRFGTVLAGADAVADELLVPRHDEFAAALDQLEGRAEFVVKGRYVDEKARARREEDARALREAMDGVCVASVVKKTVHDLDAFHLAFLVAVDEESEVERVIGDLAREWEGRVEIRLLGPMAAYDFATTNSD